MFTDKNECKQFGVCSHICNNTKGSHKCSCHKYFTRINDTCKVDSEYCSVQHYQWIGYSYCFSMSVETCLNLSLFECLSLCHNCVCYI